MSSYLRLLITIIAASLCVLFALSKGSIPLPLDQLMFHANTPLTTLFWDIRLPRTLTAFITGGLLGLAGALLQILLANPLADPYVMGISSASALTMLVLTLCGVSGTLLIGGAWTGGLLAIAILFTLAKRHHFQAHTMLLMGLALSIGLSACISLLLVLTPDRELHHVLFWLSGDLSGASYPLPGAIILFAGLIICQRLTPGLAVYLRGELAAQALGLATEKYRALLYLLSALFTATAVALAGCIGFVGLITPHLARHIAKQDQRFIPILAVLLGGTLLTIADMLARTLIAPEQIPVGILLALLGVPAFIWLLRQ